MTKKLFISLVLCLSLLGASSASAQADQKAGNDTLAQLQREGWKIVKDGVLQRELVPGEIENFGSFRHRYRQQQPGPVQVRVGTDYHYPEPLLF